VTAPEEAPVYEVTHRPDLDRDPVVVFAIPLPADEAEARLRVVLFRPAWESQDSPDTLYVTLHAATDPEEAGHGR
jgi:hypothetical protein